MGAALSLPLTRIARQRGIRGIVLTSLRDALPIESHAQVGTDVDALAAVAAALFRRARQAGEGGGFGGARLLSVEATEGRIVAAAHDDFLLVALAGRETQPALLRLLLVRALEELVPGAA